MTGDKRVLLALSGGVDSAVCVELLRGQGYDVEALVIAFSPAHAAAVEGARRAADELKVPLAVAHCEDLFREKVALPFCEAYACGRTPNPCVVCNPLVKFHVLAQHADEKGIFHIATGHYAQVCHAEGKPCIAMAKSQARDQSYMLYRLPHQILERLLMPAGELEKTEVRAVAAQAGLSSADAPDSQEICFIPDGDYPGYIRRQGFAPMQGSFIGPDGENLGPHKGVEHYTIGQRRGIGLSFPQPVFVREITPNGDVRLARAEDMFAAAVRLTDCVWHDLPGVLEGQPGLQVKIRSVARPVPCRVQMDSHAPEHCVLAFDTPQRAPAPGQHAVVYSGQRVVGGGVIDEAYAAL